MTHMRPVLAVLAATFVLSIVAWFLRAGSATHSLPSRQTPPLSTASYGVELTLTFEAGPHRFAADTDPGPSVLVEHLGQAVLRRDDVVPAGTPIMVQPISGIRQGKNSFFVRCSPSGLHDDQLRAVRLRIFRDGKPISTQSLWSEPGEPCEGLIQLVVADDADVASVVGWPQQDNAAVPSSPQHHGSGDDQPASTDNGEAELR